MLAAATATATATAAVIPAKAGIQGVTLSLRGLRLSIELGGFTPLRGASHFLLLVHPLRGLPSVEA